MLSKKIENLDGGVFDILNMLEKEGNDCPDKRTESAYKIIVVALLSTILRGLKIGLTLCLLLIFLFLLALFVS